MPPDATTLQDHAAWIRQTFEAPGLDANETSNIVRTRLYEIARALDAMARA